MIPAAQEAKRNLFIALLWNVPPLPWYNLLLKRIISEA